MPAVPTVPRGAKLRGWPAPVADERAWPRSSFPTCPVARKPNYNFEKRKKELARQEKKEAKREERQRRREAGDPVDEFGNPIDLPSVEDTPEPGEPTP